MERNLLSTSNNKKTNINSRYVIYLHPEEGSILFCVKGSTGISEKIRLGDAKKIMDISSPKIYAPTL